MVRELGIGGCERDLTKLAKGLDRARFEPHVGCFHENGLRSQELRAAGIPIVRFPVRSFGSWSALAGARQMGAYLRAHRIGLVHAFDTPTDIFAAPTARAYGVPVITSHLSYRILAPPLHRFLLRITDRLSSAMVVNSKAVRLDLEQEKISPERIHLCYNGVETEIFYPQAAPRPAILNGASLVIGSVCALRPEKRMDLLLRAFAQVRRRQPGMKLLIVGSGPMQPALEALRRDLTLEQDCILEPAKVEVADWMRAMDIFVLSSSSESFPNALLEAMACGCCAIGSDVGGVGELIEHQRSGLVFQSGDVDGLAESLLQAIDRKSWRQQMGQAAARRAREKFSMEIAVGTMQTIYDTVLHSHL